MKKHKLTFTFLLLSSLAFSQPKAFQVEITGEGQPILLLPGFTCPGEVWDETISQVGKDYKSYQFTYAGFGGVAPIELPWYTTLSESIAGYLVDNKIKKAILIGHSMGGMLAMDLAAELPDRVAKVVLVDALPCIREMMMPEMKSEDIVYDNPHSLRMLAMPDSAFRQMATYMAEGMSLQQERHNELINYILTSDKKTYVYGYTDLLKLDLRPKLSEIKAPVLVLAADFPNEEIASKTMNSQFANLKNKEIKMAKSSRHFIMFDQPEWFYSQLNGFLK